MELNKVIDAKINMLVDLMLTDGVSPSEFADNIFSEEYCEVSFYKEDNHIIGKLVFTVEKVITVMKYTYTVDRKVMKIEEEEEEGKCIILWDRKMREIEIIQEILSYMEVFYKSDQILNFVKTLPISLQQKFMFELSKSA